MNKAHLYLLGRLYDVDEADMQSYPQIARALVRIWKRARQGPDYICRYTGISEWTLSKIYGLAGEQYENPANRRKAMAGHD
jgi:hypothetical protein